MEANEQNRNRSVDTCNRLPAAGGARVGCMKEGEGINQRTFVCDPGTRHNVGTDLGEQSEGLGGGGERERKQGQVSWHKQ